MTEHARSAEHARLADVLDALRADPTDVALRARRVQASRRALARGDVAQRMLLAEHYRSIGAPDQAARHGVVEPGWVRASELRALRRTVLAHVAGGTVRGFLGLRRRAPSPVGIADLVEADEPGLLERVGGPARLLATIAWAGGFAWWCTVMVRAVVAITQGADPLDALRAVRPEGLVAVAVWLVGLLVRRRQDRLRPAVVRDRSSDAVTRRRVERVLRRLLRHDEQHALLRAWLDRCRTTSAQEPVRRMLVDLARERRRPAEAGRWGIAVDGLTTPDERARFAATLRAGDGWMLERERRTDRAPSRLGIDERDALIRAGVAADAIDRRWMTNADRLSEIERDRIARVLAELVAHPSAALRRERAAIVRAATRAPDPDVRRLLAEHYRALGKPEQAGRWGVADGAWATVAEVRALRLDLLEQRPTHATRAYLGLAHDEPLPDAVGDIERSGASFEHPLDMVGGVLAVTGVLAFLLGLVLLPVAGVLALLSIEQPGWLWPTIAGCGATVVIAGGGASGVFLLAGRAIARATRRDPYARELRRRLPGLTDPAERRSLAIGALDSRAPRTRSTARHVLVDASRRLGRGDEVARWAASIEDATTADERAALAARLARRRDPMRTYVARSHREPGPLRVDERDVLRRAGVPVEAMDAFDSGG